MFACHYLTKQQYYNILCAGLPTQQYGIQIAKKKRRYIIIFFGTIATIFSIFFSFFLENGKIIFSKPSILKYYLQFKVHATLKHKWGFNIFSFTFLYYELLKNRLAWTPLLDYYNRYTKVHTPRASAQQQCSKLGR